LKKITLLTIFISIFLLGGFYQLQSKDQSNDVETPYVKAIYSKPITYDPAQMNDGASLIFSELVYEGLLRFTENYGLQAGLAKSWETSLDGKTITFTLDEKAKFHNGDRVTANDVVVSLNRLLTPKSKVHKYYSMITKVQATDILTVNIELKNPFAPILYVLAGGTAKIFPATLVNTRDFFVKPIGSGPFKLLSVGEVDIKLLRFEHYHSDMPQIKNLILRSVNQTEAMNEAKVGKIHDLASWPLSGMEKIFNYGQDISTVVADTWIIGFNTRIAPLNDLKVRKAFKQSIDSEKFRLKFYPSAAKAYGYVPVGFPGHFENKKETIKLDIPKHSLITITIPKERKVFGLLVPKLIS
jgi:ABC-type transport system substrate-binding protein